MDWRERLASISANLDDLQTGIDGGCRAADGVRRDAAAMNGGTDRSSRDEDLLRSLARHATEMESCASHQQGAMQELRQNLAELRRDLKLYRRFDRPGP